MEKTRVPKGERYYFIDILFEVKYAYERGEDVDDLMFDKDNYFHTEEEAESMARKLRAVLNGVDVIKMPNEGEVFVKARGLYASWCEPVTHKTRYQDEYYGFMDFYEWIKPRIVK